MTVGVVVKAVVSVASDVAAYVSEAYVAESTSVVVMPLVIVLWSVVAETEPNEVDATADPEMTTVPESSTVAEVAAAAVLEATPVSVS